jgi:hypothetical protein
VATRIVDYFEPENKIANNINFPFGQMYYIDCDIYIPLKLHRMYCVIFHENIQFFAENQNSDNDSFKIHNQMHWIEEFLVSRSDF